MFKRIKKIMKKISISKDWKFFNANPGFEYEKYENVDLPHDYQIFTTHPEHYDEVFSGTHWHFYDVNESWTYDDKYVGRPIKAETYTSADKVEWFVNGKKIGESVPNKNIASIETVYEKGYIEAAITSLQAQRLI